MAATPLISLLFSLIFGGTLLCPLANASESRPDLMKHPLRKEGKDEIVIGNCDGKGAIAVRKKTPGEKLSDAEARDISKRLMTDWVKRNPGRKWSFTREAQAVDPGTAVGTAQKNQPSVTDQKGTYIEFTPEERKVWEIEQKKMIQMGDEIFHSADKLGSKTVISCDMCHPNAANTHPETYPKYQIQLQRVALLRDMINWCIENPIKGPMLKDEDPKMRALEAYIHSERVGVPMAPGKH